MFRTLETLSFVAEGKARLDPPRADKYRERFAQPLSVEPATGFAAIRVDGPDRAAVVEVEYGGAVVRVGPDVQVEQLATVFRALQATA